MRRLDAGQRFLLPGVLALALTYLFLAAGPGLLEHRYFTATAGFLVLCILPGWSAVLLSGSRSASHPGQAIILAVPISVLILGVFTAPAFALGLGMRFVLAADIGAGMALTLLAAARGLTPRLGRVDPWSAVVACVVAIVVTSPLWLPVDLTRNGDDWWYMGYVRQYRDAAELFPRDPLGGPGGPLAPRAAIDIWLIAQGAMARLAGSDPVYLVQVFLPMVMLVLALVAAYAVAEAIWSRREIAGYAFLALLAMSALDLAAPEGFGSTLLIRAAQDKVVSAFVSVPAILIAAWALRGGRAGDWIVLAVVAAGTSLIHPGGLLLAAVGLSSFGILELVRGRIRLPSAGLRWVLLCSAALLVIPPLALWGLVADEASFLFTTEAGPRLPFRVIDLPAGLYMGNPGLLRHPLLIVAVLVSIAYCWRSRATRAASFLACCSLAPLAVMLFPPTAVLAGRLMAPAQLWRLIWLVPVGPLLAISVVEAGRRLWPRRPAAGAAAAFAALVVTAAVTTELMAGLGRGYFASAGEPGLRQSVILQGFDSLVAGDERLTPDQGRILRATVRMVPPGSRVFSDLFLARALAVYTTRLLPFAPPQTPRDNPTTRDRDLFFEARTPARLRRAILARYGMNYAIVPRDGSLVSGLAGADGVETLAENPGYLLFKITPGPPAQPLQSIGALALWGGAIDPTAEDGWVVVRLAWTSSVAVSASRGVRLDFIPDTGAVVTTEATLPDSAAGDLFITRHRIQAPDTGRFELVVRVDGATSSVVIGEVSFPGTPLLDLDEP